MTVASAAVPSARRPSGDDFEYFSTPDGKPEIGETPVALRDFATRTAAAREACVRAGIDWPETLRTPGEALYASGYETIRAHRERIERNPLAAKALPLVVSALEAQDRRDLTVDLRDLSLDPATARIRHALQRAEDGAIYSKHAFRQLVGLVPALSGTSTPQNVAGVLGFLRPAERAAIVNARVLEMPAAASQKVMLRLRRGDDDSELVRAILSEKYADVSDLHVARALLASSDLVGDGRLDYKPGDSHSRFEIVWPSEIPIETMRVADVHKAFVQVENSETGQGSVIVRGGVICVNCYNATLVEGAGVEVAIKLRHVGDAEVLRGKLTAAVRAAALQVEPLLSAIQVSARTRIPGDQKPADVFAKLARKFGVTAARAQAWGEVYDSRYAGQDAPGGTAWGISSAITEAAQDRPWWKAQAEEEEVGSAVVQRLFNVLS